MVLWAEGDRQGFRAIAQPNQSQGVGVWLDPKTLCGSVGRRGQAGGKETGGMQLAGYRELMGYGGVHTTN